MHLTFSLLHHHHDLLTLNNGFNLCLCCHKHLFDKYNYPFIIYLSTVVLPFLRTSNNKFYSFIEFVIIIMLPIKQKFLISGSKDFHRDHSNNGVLCLGVCSHFPFSRYKINPHHIEKWFLNRNVQKCKEKKSITGEPWTMVQFHSHFKLKPLRFSIGIYSFWLFLKWVSV